MPVRRATALAVIALLAAVALSGCGGGESDVVLAVRSATRPDGRVVLEVECATELRYERRADPLGSGLQQVTVFGDPQVGRCSAAVAVPDLSEDRFVDGATGQVVIVADA